jgi:hypothetical protein
MEGLARNNLSPRLNVKILLHRLQLFTIYLVNFPERSIPKILDFPSRESYNYLILTPGGVGGWRADREGVPLAGSPRRNLPLNVAWMDCRRNQFESRPARVSPLSQIPVSAGMSAPAGSKACNPPFPVLEK